MMAARAPFTDASMRPRVFPAEDVQEDVRRWGGTVASMRPRVFPAEDTHLLSTDSWSWCRFNEAAGIPRGRRKHSTRPWQPSTRFNEAAGIPRGRPTNIGRLKVKTGLLQ